MNTSFVSVLHLDGLSQLYDYRIPLAVLLLLIYGFVMLSDATVVYIICSRRCLHRPMYAVLVNSAIGSSSIYPKLLWDLFQGKRVVLLSRYECLCQALIVGFVGGSSFLLLSAMAFDRYLSICHPLRYAALMSPRAITVLLLMCWLVPLILVT
ncbi:unnamed protein product [Knipowitschia caucasica]|uniref:G-protein coupled receptors family 1 profile domain-containing protein n=1 Tax=Knipowitschia caucasica TaxID=637954 RepID=A0AAV2K2D7_KNICA